jgi:magnesium chelatase accessory protein
MMASWDIDALYAELPRLEVPTTLVAGALDRAVPLRQLRAVRDRLPRSQLRVVEAAGHLVHEEAPEAVARIVLDVAADSASPGS